MKKKLHPQSRNLQDSDTELLHTELKKFDFCDPETSDPIALNFGIQPLTSGTRCHVEAGVFQTFHTPRTTATFIPLHYEPNYAYPLIVWLHTPGEDERQLQRIMPLWSLRNYAAVSVRGSVSFGNDGLPKKGFYWDAGSYESAYTSVLEAISEIRQHINISPNRIYLAGCDEGAAMAQRLVFRNPHCFNGLISFNGGIPEDMMLLEHLRELQKVRFLYLVSNSLRACPVETLCSHLRLLYSAGVPLTLRNYPKMGPLLPEMFRDANRWIMGGIESALF